MTILAIQQFKCQLFPKSCRSNHRTLCESSRDRAFNSISAIRQFLDPGRNIQDLDLATASTADLGLDDRVGDQDWVARSTLLSTFRAQINREGRHAGPSWESRLAAI